MSNPSPSGQIALSLDHLEIPSFVSFSNEDDVITQYKKEREEIRAVYQDKDQLTITLEKLLKP